MSSSIFLPLNEEKRMNILTYTQCVGECCIQLIYVITGNYPSKLVLKIVFFCMDLSFNTHTHTYIHTYIYICVCVCVCVCVL